MKGSKKLKQKGKRIIAVILIAVFLSSVVTPTMLEVKASWYYRGVSFSCEDVCWNIGGDITNTKCDLSIASVDERHGSRLSLPTKKEIANKVKEYEYIPNFLTLDAIESTTVNIEGLSGLGEFEELYIPMGYYCFPRNEEFDYGFHREIYRELSTNTSIKTIMVNTENANGFTMREGIFANMKGLQNVHINVGDKEIQLDGSVFANCKNLENIIFTAGTITITGSYNFAGCTNLKNVTFNGDATFEGGQDFAGCSNLDNVVFNNNATFNGQNTFTSTTFENVKEANISFGGVVNSNVASKVEVANEIGVATTLYEQGIVTENTKEVATFINCENINNINFNGEGNQLENGFMKGVTIENLNIENKTTLDASAFKGCNIVNVSFNADTEVGEGAFEKCQVNNMYFNTKNITSNNGAIGKGTTVKEMYFNYRNINQDDNEINELKNFPLGEGEYALNCDAIYFLNPGFNNITGTAYDRGDGKTTEIYGYGGTPASYNGSTTPMTSKDMFEAWSVKEEGNGTIPKNCSYKNFATIEKKDEKIELYLNREEKEVEFDFNTLNIAANYNEKIKEQLPEDLDSNFNISGYKLKYEPEKADTNFSYKVLCKTSNFIDPGTYVYIENGTGDKYVYYGEDCITLTEGTHRFYIQAAGETWPLDITVAQKEIKELEVTAKDGVAHVTVGDDANTAKTKEQLQVIAKCTDGTKVELDSSQYEIYLEVGASDNKIKKDTKSLIICYKGDKLVTYDLQKIQVHEKKIKAFKVSTNKKYMPIDAEINVSDIKVTEVEYDNPYDERVGEVKNGYQFLQDGVAKDTFKIKEGENAVSVTYEGCTMEGILTIEGCDNAVKDFAVFCPTTEVELYKKTTLNVSEVSIRNVKYKDSRLEDVDMIKSGFVFTLDGKETDTVELKPGKNIIGVKYNGLDKYDAITINALDTTIEKIEAQYIGPAVYEGCEVSTDRSVLMVTVYRKYPDSIDVLLSNFDVSYGTYHIVPGDDNQIYVYYKGVKSENTISVKGLKDSVVDVNKLEYKGACKAGTKLNKKDFYVEVGYASGKTVNSEQDASILDKLSFSVNELGAGANNIQVNYNGEIQKGITITTDTDKITPSPTESVTQTPLVNTTPVVSVTPGEGSIPSIVTGTVINEDSKPSQGSEGILRPKKGEKHTINGVKYEITSETKTGGKVSVVGYDKNASKVKLQTSVEIEGYKFVVNKIEKGAFKNCSKLKGTVNLTKNIKSVGDNAFSKCKNIEKVVFGSNVTQIGKNSFADCKKLKCVQFKTGSVKKIGKNAFKGIAKGYTLKTPKALKKTYKKRLKNAF